MWLCSFYYYYGQKLPNSTFYGFDYHAQSIKSARKQAEKEAPKDGRVKFEAGSATNFNGSSSAAGEGSGGYDLITFFVVSIICQTHIVLQNIQGML